MAKSIYQTVFWKEAATSGFKLGIALLVVITIDTLATLQPERSWIVTLLRFAAIAGAAYYFPGQLARRCGHEGLSYGQSVSYILALMFFAGIIDGLVQFVFHNYLAPAYFQEMMTRTLEIAGIDPAVADMTRTMMNNPVFMVFSGIFSLILYGGFIGLFASIFVRRPSTPIHEENGKSEEEH